MIIFSLGDVVHSSIKFSAWFNIVAPDIIGMVAILETQAVIPGQPHYIYPMLAVAFERLMLLFTDSLFILRPLQ